MNESLKDIAETVDMLWHDFNNAIVPEHSSLTMKDISSDAAPVRQVQSAFYNLSVAIDELNDYLRDSSQFG